MWPSGDGRSHRPCWRGSPSSSPPPPGSPAAPDARCRAAEPIAASRRHHPGDLMRREDLIDRVRTGDRWDLVVIGGGATGLGAAVDSAARGYRTLLLEAHDFAKGTSSRSTKLIHGG